MSWIFGVLGNSKAVNKPTLNRFLPKADVCVQTEHLLLLCGGNAQTHFFDHKNETHGWCVVGLGINRSLTPYTLMQQGDWQQLLQQKEPDTAHLGGHWLILKWQNDHLFCQSDPLGLRNLYFTRLNTEHTLFSTRADWLARCNPKVEIDYKKFSSQWLISNRLTGDSALTEVERLSAGTAKVTPQKLIINNQPWAPHFKFDKTGNDLANTLIKNSTFASGPDLSLSLSGGVDSRVLLAALAQSTHNNFKTHSFGSASFIENRLAKKLADTVGVTHQNLSLDHKRYSEDDIADFIGASQATLAFSSIINSAVYSHISAENSLVIDGGFGEISRRRYLNRLYWFGKKALLNGDFKGMLPHFSHHRAHIFSSEAEQLMQQSLEAQLATQYNALPAIKSIGIGNWLDLFSIRTRLNNYTGIEQSRIDSQITNYMPFAQVEFLETLLNTPERIRKNNRFSKQVIKSLPALTHFPFSKEGMNYPFHTPYLLGTLILRIRKKAGYFEKENSPITLLQNHKSFILELLAQQQAHPDPVLKPKQIEHNIHAFFNGEAYYATFVDWWLAYTIWQKQVSSKIDILK